MVICIHWDRVSYVDGVARIELIPRIEVSLSPIAFSQYASLFYGVIAESVNPNPEGSIS
jgi:hypothetical protein